MAQLSCGLDGCFAAVLAQVLVGHDLAADELVLKVGVDDAGSLGGLCAPADCPRADLDGAACEVPNELWGMDDKLVVRGARARTSRLA